MKKLYLATIFFASIFITKAQSSSSPEGEIKYNILNTILIGSVELGYEYFIDGNQSAGAELLINDGFSYRSMRRRNGRNFKTNSILVSYNFYLSSDQDGSGFMVAPFAKYRFGDFEENGPRLDDGTLTTLRTRMNSFIMGLNFGYKWVYNDSFAIAPYANLGRNFSNTVKDRFSAIELNAGVSVGYRF